MNIKLHVLKGLRELNTFNSIAQYDIVTRDMPRMTVGFPGIKSVISRLHEKCCKRLTTCRVGQKDIKFYYNCLKRTKLISRRPQIFPVCIVTLLYFITWKLFN